jgi:hypothetical protein
MTSCGRVSAIVIASMASLFSYDTSAADPEQTAEALMPLLRSVDQVIPKASSCFGHYGQRGRPRIRDLIGSRLAYLHDGSNVVVGACNAPHCHVEIRHAAGEDVAAAHISFVVRNGKIAPSTLECVMTP